jgi:hypothetical protein
MWRVFEAIVDFLRPRTAQSRVLEMALELQRLDQRLFELCEALIQPMDIEKIRQGRVPETVVAELYRMIEFVRLEYLGEAIRELIAVSQTTDEALREEFFERPAPGERFSGTIRPPRRRTDGQRRASEATEETEDGR